MASQRRAPTKRPPRPAAKKPPPPPSAVEGTDAAERPTKTTKPGAAPAVKAGAGATGKTGSSATAKNGAPAAAKAGTAPATMAGDGNGAAGTAAKSGTASAKSAAPGGVTKTNAGGGNYRPPSGAPRSRRPPPPPKRKRQITKKTIGAIVALALIGALVVFFSLAVNGGNSSTAINTALTPEGIPVASGPFLASVDTARYPSVIDGIKCETSEQVAYHVHAHLAIFVDGSPRQIPYGIGIDPPLQTSTTNGTFVSGGSCFYWLHTHAGDGVIHIESPTQATYTLGQFFDMWGQPLQNGQVGPAVGPTTVYVNGKVFTGDPRTIQLSAHEDIQLDVGKPAPAPVAIDWSATQL